MTDFKPFDPLALQKIGTGLNRPECVVAASDGLLYTADWTHGIAKITQDGAVSSAVEADLIGEGFLPNGIALMPDGTFLFANLGEAGGVWQVGAAGAARPFLAEVDGRKIPPANFVLVDGARVWITVSASTRGHTYFNAHEDTGEIILVEDGRARVVATGLNWTNELRITKDRKHLFVNETFACRTRRYDLGADDSLSNPFDITFPDGTFPDGLAFDTAGGLWVACVVSNRIIHIPPDGNWTIMFEDLPPNFVEITAAYSAGKMTRDMIVDCAGAHVSNLSSLAFGGPDLKTLYLGGLTIDGIMAFASPVTGQRMAHWP